MNPRYPFVAERAGQRCEYCHAPEAVFNFAFEVEHIRPRSRGGEDSPNNLALACSACNLYKSDTEIGWDDETAQDVPLFHPRVHIWEEHFSVDLDSVAINGTTPIGRVTVELLQLNRPRHLAARQRWMRLGLFP